jgi:hypothetical protein
MASLAGAMAPIAAKHWAQSALNINGSITTAIAYMGKRPYDLLIKYYVYLSVCL